MTLMTLKTLMTLMTLMTLNTLMTLKTLNPINTPKKKTNNVNILKIIYTFAPNNTKMIAAILAAGMAKRLRPLTDTQPKCMLKVGTRSLIGRTAEALLQAGISEAVVVTGYRGEMIHSFLDNNYPELNAHYVVNEDYETTNSIYSLWLTKTYTAGRDFMLLDSDILFHPDIITRLLEEEGTVLAMNRHACGEEEMKVVVDSRGMVCQISKGCDPQAAAGELVGIEKIDAAYSKALFEELAVMQTKEHLTGIFYEKAFERLIAKGFLFRAIDTTKMFSMELDTIDDFARAKEIIPKELF